ncbi:MAG: sensor histidine kinase, partial [Candidatus Saccharimonadales bacterium]
SEDWPQIINSAVADMALRADLQKVTIKTIAAPDLPPVAADRTSLYEVLSNLLDNAIKYSPNGGTVTIKARSTKDGEIETTVQDQGIGIPLSLMPNLFERFYRSHRSRGQIGGTGLGLYLSKAIVAAHGGHIWVRSREGRGTSFGFTLLPYDKLPATPDEASTTNTAEAWIKNHSLYRR